MGAQIAGLGQGLPDWPFDKAGARAPGDIPQCWLDAGQGPQSVSRLSLFPTSTSLYCKMLRAFRPAVVTQLLKLLLMGTGSVAWTLGVCSVSVLILVTRAVV